VIRIYQLRTDVNFRRATLEAFWNDDRAVLDKDLVGDAIEIVLYPEENMKLEEITIQDETVFLGAAANFYDPDINQWRYLFDVSSSDEDEILIAVGRNKVLIANPRE
jgi:type VI secretion system VasD/TssJ family lipoprotein